ncbi:TRAP transporter large permease subunit [Acuticoccus sp.]|uniref:TRAP transporter large permease subunit n=1 Tax=Acuticoccus sp. TaxID=1904378 RepID=UPI003B51C671
MALLRLLENLLAGLTYLALFAMMALITADALGRYLLRITPPDVFHFTELYLMPMVIFLAMAQTQRERGHVNVTLLSQFVPPALAAAILSAVFLAAAVICAMIAVASWQSAWPHLANWRVTGGVVPWPTGLSRVIVPVGMGLLSLRLFVDAGVEARRALGGAPPVEEDMGVPRTEGRIVTVGLPLVGLLVLIGVGAPIAYALLISGTVALFVQVGERAAMGILGTSPYARAADFLLTTIPMFVLMAEFLSSSRIAGDIFRAGYMWVGHLRGGLAVATTLASAGFAALSGSSPAAAATMSAIAVPEMRRYGYADRLSLGVVASAGTLAVIIPPSIVLILYGILTETSIGRLFVAGFVPGIITAVAYIVLIQVWVRVSPAVAPPLERPFSRAERMGALRPVGPALLLVVVVLGGIYSGVVTPTEAGALGASGALVIGLLFSGLRGEGILEALRRTARTTAMIFTIVIAASIFSYFLTISQVAQNLIVWVEGAGLAPFAVLMIVLAIYLALGAFLDPVSILILTLPLAFPLVTSLGYDAIWFGVVATKMVEIGLVTPPVGINVFVAAGAVGARLQDAFAGAALFVVADLAVLAILIAFPEVVTFLPDLLYGA